MPGAKAALNTVENLIRKLDAPPIDIFPRRCSHMQSRRSACSECLDVCSAQAITLRNPKLEIDFEKCSRCLACVTVCPMTAFYAAKPSQEDFSEALYQITLTTDGHPVIACEAALSQAGGAREVNRARVVPAPCLDCFDEVLLVDAIAAGAREVTLCSAECVSCGKGSSGAVCSLVVEAANTLLEAWGREPAIILHDGLVPEVFDQTISQRVKREDAVAGAYSRRGFFDEVRSRSGQAASMTARTVLSGGIGGTVKDLTGVDLSQDPKDKRRLFAHTEQLGTYRSGNMLGVLALMGMPTAEQVDTRFWGSLVIDTEKCSGCRVCTNSCPTKAIERITQENEEAGTISSRLEFRATRCVQCRICETACPHKALTLESRVVLDDLVSETVRVIELPTNATDKYFRNRKKDTIAGPGSEVFVHEAHAPENRGLEDGTSGRMASERDAAEAAVVTATVATVAADAVGRGFSEAAILPEPGEEVSKTDDMSRSRG